MSVTGAVIKTGMKATSDIVPTVTKQLGDIASSLGHVTKSLADTVGSLGKRAYDEAPSIIGKYPRLAVGVAGAGGAGLVTGTYMGLEAISPYVPGDFNFAFGTTTPEGNVWKPYNQKTGKYEEEKKDYGYLKYIAIAGIGVVGIFGIGYLLRQANTTVELVKS